MATLAELIEKGVPDELRLAAHPDGQMVNSVIATILYAINESERITTFGRMTDVNAALVVWNREVFAPHIAKEDEDWGAKDAKIAELETAVKTVTAEAAKPKPLIYKVTGNDLGSDRTVFVVAHNADEATEGVLDVNEFVEGTKLSHPSVALSVTPTEAMTIPHKSKRLRVKRNASSTLGAWAKALNVPIEGDAYIDPMEAKYRAYLSEDEEWKEVDGGWQNVDGGDIFSPKEAYKVATGRVSL